MTATLTAPVRTGAASVALRLGRVSNLPTVWSNALAGIVLAGAEPWQAATLLAMLALSLSYTGGMFLNDAFDREMDARERPTRPIPAGEVSAATVFAAGFALLLAGLAALAPAAWLAGVDPMAALLAGMALSAMILAYDRWHKGNPFGPLLMGACRVLAYLAAGLALAATASPALLAAAAVALSYLIGLTYIAKQESLGQVRNLWPLLFLAAPLPYGVALSAQGGGLPVAILLLALMGWIGHALRLLLRRRPGDIPQAVVRLIAGIALLDALFLAGQGAMPAALVALGCFAATLGLQRWVSGT